MAVFTPTITGLTSLTTENINIDNNSITALNSSIEQVSYTSLSENFIKRSEEISNSAVWGILNNTSVSADNVTDPNGTTTADSLSIATANNSGVNQTGVSSVTTGNHTFSLYVKRIGSVDQTARLLLGDGISSSLAGFTATSSWQRVSVTKNMASTNITVQIRNADAGGVKTIAVWGAQVNSGSSAGVYFPTTIGERLAITGVTRGVSGSTAATANSGAAVTIGSVSTTLTENISATQDYIPLASLTGVAASGSAVIGTSNMDLNLSASGTGSVTINEIKTNSVTGEVIPGKIGGTNFTNSLLIGHSTTGTLNAAQHNTGVGVGALDALTQGDNNTAIGSNAGTLITTGTRNTMLGSGAGDSLNSTVNNTLIGSLAGASIANSGHYNTLIGKSAGQTLTTGDGNVIIGVVNSDSDTGNRQLKIAGFDGTTTTTWIKGDSAGLVTMSGGILTPTITGLTSLTTENVNIDNNSITAVASNIEQFTHTGIVRNWFYPSEALDNSDFIKRGNTTVTANQIAAPDGTNTADKVEGVGRANSTYSDIYRSINGISQEALEHSFYIKRISTSGIITVMNPANSSHGLWELDLSALSNDWERIHKDHSAVTVTNAYRGWYSNANSNYSAGFHISTLDSNTTGDYDFYIWGIQIDTSSTLGDYIPNASTVGGVVGIGGLTRGTSGTTATTVNSGTTINLGSFSTTTTSTINATGTKVILTTDSGSPSGPGTGTFGTSNIDLNLLSSGTGSVTINEIKTNSVTGEVIPGKIGGTNFTNSLLVGHATSGTLNNAQNNTGVGIGAMTKLTTADNNTTLGHNAGGNITSGGGNTFIGMMAGQTVAGGTNNTAVGKLAGGGMGSAANFNVCLGEDAGFNITSGDGNVIIGTVNAASATGDRQLAIGGYDGTTTTTWLTGDSSGNLTTIGDVTLANSKKVIFGDAGENIVGDGTDLTIASSGAMLIDVGTTLTLDGATQVNLSDSGTNYGSLSFASNALRMTSQISDNDILFRGNDGGSYFTALTLDMSEAGSAYFNNKVGIGTTSPSHLLEIAGSGTPININSTNDEVKKIQFENSGSVVGYIGSSAGTPFRVLNGSASEFLRITSTGLVGIGTTNPFGALHVQGVNNQNTAVINTIGTSPNYILSVRDDNTPKFVVAGTGKVGIGEDVPLGLLHVKSADSGASVNVGGDEVVVENSSDAGISILSGTSSKGQLIFGDSGDNNIARLQYTHSDNSMQIFTNAAERMRITSAGSVGIGTTTPETLLHLSSPSPVITFQETDQSNRKFMIGSFGNAYAIYDATNTQYRYILDNAGNHIFNEGGLDCDFRVESDNATNALFVQGSNGHIGINTSSPTYALNIANGAGNMRIKTTDTANVANASTSLLEFHGSNNRAGYVGFVGGDMRIHTDTHSAGNISLNTNGSERVRINSDGSTLVGSSSNLTDSTLNVGGQFGLSSGRGFVFEKQEGANGSYSSITLSFTTGANGRTCFIETMVGSSGYYLHHIAHRYSGQTVHVLTNDGNGPTISWSVSNSGSNGGSVYTYVINFPSSTSHPYVKFKVSLGGYITTPITSTSIAFA